MPDDQNPAPGPAKRQVAKEPADPGEIGAEHRGEAVIPAPSPELGGLSLPRSDSRPWRQPVATPCSLSSVIECVS